MTSITHIEEVKLPDRSIRKRGQMIFMNALR